MKLALFISVFVIATCGLVYELIAGTLASYLLGDTVLQFSTVIGAYLFAMGVGSYLSRYIGKGLVARFVQVEALVGLVGGSSATLLSVAFVEAAAGFRVALYGLVFVVGTLVGLEIPLIIQILKDRLSLKDLVAQVLALDYIGALAASLLFPLVFMPKLGLLRTSFLIGLANALVALWALRIFKEELPRSGWLKTQCLAVIGVLLLGFAGASRVGAWADANLYADDVILARSTPYQKIVVTRSRHDVRLFLNGHLQFSSLDEHRYHESLVHPGLSAVRSPREVLILGGGDGLAAREVLRHPAVERVTLVDLDAEVTRLFASNPALAGLNEGSLRSAKLKVVNADAFTWLDQDPSFFDFVVVDFPDPSNHAVGKLYTTAFYSLLKRHLRPGGMVAVQATSPLFARRSFWCIEATMGAGGLHPVPYHVYVPSFGEWGFVLGTMGRYQLPETLPAGLKFLTPELLPSLFVFSKDMGRVPSEPNRLNTQTLVHLYDEEWEKINF
ncbi:MAG: polyamine aminopropyltransferase [Elusimicrobia bacterium]|nr:polyamine aminopropyltransferase [Elusimicrobiota bacterium]